MGKKKSTWVIFSSILAGLILVVMLGVNPLLRNFLSSQVREKLVGNFYYGYENLTVDLLTRSVTLKNVTWKFPKDNTVFNHGGRISRLRISGISLISLMTGNNFRIDKIQFDSLGMLTRIKDPVKEDTLPKPKIYKDGFNFYDLIKGQMESLKVGKIEINNGTATWLNPETKMVWRKISSVKFDIKRIELDSAIAAASNGWFTLDDAKLEGRDGELFLADSLHKVRMQKLSLSYSKKSIRFDSLEIIPLFSKPDMARKTRYETDRMEMVVPHVEIAGIDIRKFMTDNQLRIDRIDIDRFHLVAYRDKNLPTPLHLYKSLPHAKLRNLSLNVTVDTLHLIDAYVQYEQRSDITQKVGMVFFSNLNANFYNISNDSLSYVQKGNATLDASAKLMGKSTLAAKFTFNLKNRNGDHWFKGSLSKFDLTDLNSVFVPLAAVSISSGQVQQMNFDVRLNNDVSDGKVAFLYSDLKIEKLNKDNLNGNELNNTIKSMLANTFLLKKSNPSGKSNPRVGIVHFDRAKDKSIFNFWWKSILEGIKSTTLNTEESK